MPWRRLEVRVGSQLVRVGDGIDEDVRNDALHERGGDLAVIELGLDLQQADVDDALVPIDEVIVRHVVAVPPLGSPHRLDRRDPVAHVVGEEREPVPHAERVEEPGLAVEEVLDLETEIARGAHERAALPFERVMRLFQ
jgi:hypothetical protein